MKNERTTAAFRLYYENVIKERHNNPSLIAPWGADPSRFETQILCRKIGTPVPDSQKYECDGEVFGPSRWPYDPAGEPNYSDPPIKYNVSTRLKCIGTTWWDWKNKHTVALGYDLDSLVDHSSGITPEQLEKFDHLDIPWLEIVRSTRGNGRHLYIKFKEPFPVTQNHTEHAAVARAFIPLISKHTGLDIEASVDVCGQVMWIHHIAATKENKGYERIKPATQILTADFVPPNWQDNLEVVSGGRSKVRVQGWTPQGTTEGDELDDMTRAHAKVHLDDVHLKILEALEGTGHTCLWVYDHHLWQGHTGALKQVYDDFAEAGTPLRGLFDTNSPDTDPGKVNAFMRPKLNGAWDVYRFGEGTEECPLWDSNSKWTRTTFNYPATLKQICLACGGYAGTEEKHGYQFDTVEDLKKALELLESKIELPLKAEGRSLSLLPGAGGKVLLAIESKRGDIKGDFPRFVKTPGLWKMTLGDAIDTSDAEIEEDQLWSELDAKLRALILDSGRGSAFDGWVLRDATNKWVEHPRENIKSFLASMGFNKPDPILGGAVFKSWTLVNDPFQAEYPGGRKWNRDAAQFVYAPVDLQEGEEINHPSWTRLVEHCGEYLNDYLPDLSWCEDWDIVTGGDYLTAWIACMFQNPYGKLPYLFMFGPQNCGKSSFHEAISLLMRGGVVPADRALTSDQGYNGELRDAVLAVVDEVDISKAGTSAYNKMKDWVVGIDVAIHDKYRRVEAVRSSLHFVQMANEPSSLPIFPGDTRVTAMQVTELMDEIPRDRFRELLREEAPHFMRTLMDMEIPEATGRLMLPVIETQVKADAAASNVDELAHFIEDSCYAVAGAALKFSDFKDRFIESLEEHQRGDWRDRHIRNRLSDQFPVGRGIKLNQTIIGNITFNKDLQPSEPFIKSDGRVMKESDK